MKKYIFVGLMVELSAQAAIVSFQLSPLGSDSAVGLTPANMVPAVNASSGSGNAISSGIVFDTTTSFIDVAVGYGSAAGFTDLTGAANAVHIHGPAQAGTIAPVLVDLQPYLFQAADTTKGGIIFGHIPWSAVNVNNLLAGLVYLDICTVSFPGGEIRGQLIPIPCPLPIMVAAPPTNLTVECGTPLTLIVSATGTGTLSYHWEHNSVPIPGATGPGLSLAAAHFSDGGDYKIVVTDSCGSVETSVQLIVQDTTQPMLSLPPDIIANATSKTGAVVTFQATAFDSCAGNLPVGCTPASGSTFPIGVTTVNCSANDGNGNLATGSFIVTILKPHHP